MCKEWSTQLLTIHFECTEMVFPCVYLQSTEAHVYSVVDKKKKSTETHVYSVVDKSKKKKKI